MGLTARKSKACRVRTRETSIRTDNRTSTGARRPSFQLPQPGKRPCLRRTSTPKPDFVAATTAPASLIPGLSFHAELSCHRSAFATNVCLFH